DATPTTGGAEATPTDDGTVQPSMQPTSGEPQPTGPFTEPPPTETGAATKMGGSGAAAAIVAVAAMLLLPSKAAEENSLPFQSSYSLNSLLIELPLESILGAFLLSTTCHRLVYALQHPTTQYHTTPQNARATRSQKINPECDDLQQQQQPYKTDNQQSPETEEHKTQYQPLEENRRREEDAHHPPTHSPLLPPKETQKRDGVSP
ncbi:hypothetical protein V493_02330, partial [Pseudogymnoascus sp. VKM F-4281 (FW-2241)]